MGWLTAVGALAPSLLGVVDDLTGSTKAKADAATAAANAQTAQINAQLQLKQAELDAQRAKEQAAAEQTKTYALYSVVAVVLAVGGYLLSKAL